MHLKKIHLIILLALVLAACGPAGQTPVKTDTTSVVQATSTPVPSPTTPSTPSPEPLNMPPVPNPNLIQIQFLDAFRGWGIATLADSGLVMRSVDGGATWHNATPTDATGIGYSSSLAVLDELHAWLLLPNADFFTGKLYRTEDGGASWQASDAPFGGGRLQFLDATTGRVMADRGAGAGSNAVEIFQTSDGGATWLSVFNDDPTRPDASESLPLGGIKNGMTFLDGQNGWVTGSRPLDGDVYLYHTLDGGITWEQQSIPLPAGYTSYQYYPQAPVFFGQDGFLPLMIYTAQEPILTFFVTQDGGQTWAGDPTAAVRIIPPCTFTFADALHSWCWDGGTKMRFTSDGALTWQEQTTSLDLSGQLLQLAFLPDGGGSFTGWALTITDANGQSSLFHTLDGGASWQQLLP